jgi:hypothetical protein
MRKKLSFRSGGLEYFGNLSQYQLGRKETIVVTTINTFRNYYTTNGDFGVDMQSQ